jgi:hypothetical protein
LYLIDYSATGRKLENSMFLSNPVLGTKEAYVPGLTQEYVAKTYGIPASDVAKLGSFSRR